jgi:hypothetical protein
MKHVRDLGEDALLAQSARFVLAIEGEGVDTESGRKVDLVRVFASARCNAGWGEVPEVDVLGGLDEVLSGDGT